LHLATILRDLRIVRVLIFDGIALFIAKTVLHVGPPIECLPTADGSAARVSHDCELLPLEKSANRMIRRMTIPKPLM
jgi:hypothetical protein